MDHKELKLIMETIQANFTEESTLVIQGIKGNVSTEGMTKSWLSKFILPYSELIKKPVAATSFERNRS